MIDKTEYSRLVVKRCDTTGIVPTIPTGTTLSTFINTDILPGEFYGNLADNKLWWRSNNGIIELPTASFTGGTITGPSNFTGGLTANTFSATTYLGLPLDIRVTGGTYSAGTTTFTNNTGGTFSISGFNTDTDFFASGSTTGATPFTLALPIVSLATNTAAIAIKATITGLNLTEDKAYISELFAAIRTNSSVVTMFGGVDKLEKSEYSTATSTIGIDTSNAAIIVTGEVGETIKWLAKYEVVYRV